MARATEPANKVRIGLRPKIVTVGQSMTFRVFGHQLNGLVIRTFPAPTSNTHNDWSTPINVQVRNNYIEIDSTPGSRRRRSRDDEGDVTITITFDDGTTDGQTEAITCNDIVYEESSSKAAKNEKASAKGNMTRTAASGTKRGGASQGKKKPKK